MAVDVVQVIIRPFSQEDSIPAITALLHRAYGALAAAGFRFYASHQDDEATRRRLSKGHAFIAEQEGRIVGTVTLTTPENTRGCAWYDRDDVASFGQFAVEPELQHSGLGSRMLEVVEETARSLGYKYLALDTAEGAMHLIEYYAKRGYAPVDHVQWHSTNYLSLVMSKQL